MGVYWSLSTLFLYLLFAAFGMICISKAVRSEKKKTIISFEIYFIVIWSSIATFRFMNGDIGGYDAVAYRDFFTNCLDEYYTPWMQHAGDDIVFKWINVIIRQIVNDYHVYFFIVYGFIAWSYISFLKVFSDKNFNVAPYIMTFLIYLYSFNTLRSHLASCFLLWGCIILQKGHRCLAFVIALMACLTHKSLLVYVPCILFCIYFMNRTLKLKHVFILIALLSLLGGSVQAIFVDYAHEVDLHGSYSAYAQSSLGKSFFDNFWKIAFEQMFLGGFMLVYYKNIKHVFLGCGDIYKNRAMKLLWLLCVYDIILIPLCFILGIWRSYEYLYIARIAMWCFVLYLIGKNSSRTQQTYFTFCYTMAFAAWIIFRIYNTYDHAGLMPYIFEPLMHI